MAVAPVNLEVGISPNLLVRTQPGGHTDITVRQCLDLVERTLETSELLPLRDQRLIKADKPMTTTENKSSAYHVGIS